LDIAGAYPPEAGLRLWQRTITLRRGQEIEIADVYELGKPAVEITLSLLTPCVVILKAPGQILLSGASLPDDRCAGGGVLTYDAGKFGFSAQEIAIGDARLNDVWGERLTRLAFTVRDPAQEDMWTFRVRA